MQKMWDRIMASRRHSRGRHGNLVKPVSSITCPSQTLGLLCFNQCSLLLTGTKLSKIWINCLAGWTKICFWWCVPDSHQTKQNNIHKISQEFKELKCSSLRRLFLVIQNQFPLSNVHSHLQGSSQLKAKACLAGWEKAVLFHFPEKNVFVLQLIDWRKG